MAYSSNTYTATAAQTDFTITWSYIAASHVKVYVDGVLKTLTTHYTLPSSSVVRFVTPMTGGELVFIKRETSRSARLVDYESGSSLNEEELDQDSLQAFYLVQEALDAAEAALSEDSADNEFDAESKNIKNVADPTAAQDAATKAYVDAATSVAGNVPTPIDPDDDNKLLKAGGGLFSWGPTISSFVSSILNSASAAAFRTAISAAPSTALQNVVEDASPQSGGAFDMNANMMMWSKGADVASAATLSIGSDGNYFDVTGTTAITQIAQKGVGTVVRLHFDGALVLTHSADLVLPNSANIVTRAGDEAVFIEYVAGDWRCVNYYRNSGAAMGQSRWFISGMVPSRNGVDSDHDTDITAGVARDDTNAVNIELTSTITKQIDAAWAAGSGAGGLDTGTVTANTWYYVYAIGKGDGEGDVVISASNSSPTMPSGYGYKRMIAQVLTDGSANITAYVAFELSGGGIKYDWYSATTSYSGSPTASAYTNVSLDVPNLVVEAHVGSRGEHASASVYWWLVPKDVIANQYVRLGGYFSASNTGATYTIEGGNEMRIRTDASGDIYLFTSLASTTIIVNTSGWLDHRRH